MQDEVTPQLSYFCGYGPECGPGDPSRRLAAAMRNVEGKYAVVGVLEDMDVTIQVLQDYVPRQGQQESDEMTRCSSRCLSCAGSSPGWPRRTSTCGGRTRTLPVRPRPCPPERDPCWRGTSGTRSSSTTSAGRGSAPSTGRSTCAEEGEREREMDTHGGLIYLITWIYAGIFATKRRFLDAM